MEKLKDVLAFTVTTLAIIGFIILLFNMEIEVKPLNSREFYTFISVLAAVIVIHFSFKRVDKFFDRKIKELDGK